MEKFQIPYCHLLEQTRIYWSKKGEVKAILRQNVTTNCCKKIRQVSDLTMNEKKQLKTSKQDEIQKSLTFYKFFTNFMIQMNILSG